MYKNEPGALAIELPQTATSISYTIKRNGILEFTGTAANPVNGIASINIPWPLTTNDTVLDVVVTFVVSSISYSETYQIPIVTPILSRHVAETIMPGKFDQYEPIVRGIIENYTHQSFYKALKTLSFYGNDKDIINLPERLISINTIGDEYNTYTPSGFIINADYLSVSSYISPYDDNVIVSPYTNNSAFFKSHAIYTINGIWGWSPIPEAVVEAAKLLFIDRACPDIAYSEKQLLSVKTDMWKVDINPASQNDSTGNLTADRLLQPYRKHEMLII